MRLARSLDRHGAVQQGGAEQPRLPPPDRAAALPIFHVRLLGRPRSSLGTAQAGAVLLSPTIGGIWGVRDAGNKHRGRYNLSMCCLSLKGAQVCSASAGQCHATPGSLNASPECNPQETLCRCVVLVLSLRLARLGSVEPLTWRLVRAWLPVNLLCAPRMS